MKQRAWLLVTILCSVVHLTFAQQLTVYGPRVFERSTGQPVTVVATFTIASSATPPYMMRVLNGSPNGTHRVSSATIKLNGSNLLTPSSFNQQVGVLEKAVDLQAENRIEVRLASAPGSYLTIEIMAEDNSAPTILLSAPVPDLITSESVIVVGGSIEPATGTTLTINGNAADLGVDGFFHELVSLPLEGANHITVAATNARGYSAQVTRTVIRDTQQPVVSIAFPVDGYVTAQAEIVLTGQVTDPNPVAISVNTILLDIDSLGVFSKDVPLDEGQNSIHILAEDAAGNSTQIVLVVTRDTTPPDLVILSPPDGIFTNQPTITINGIVADATTVEAVTVNGVPHLVGHGGAFSGSVLLVEGQNTITASAVDAAGNSTSVSILVVRDMIPPAITILTPINGTTTSSSEISIIGSVMDVTSINLTINGLAVMLNPDGSFSGQVVLSEGQNTITVIATDAAGNESTVFLVITLNTLPPLPLLVAPPLDSTVIAVPFARAVEFLYSDDNPVQTDVVTASLTPKCLTVVRGMTIAPTGQPLPGVMVEVLNRPEFGRTVSRADGVFDMVVNGGKSLTLVFSKDGLLPAQRPVATACGEFVYADTVALVPLDPVVTTVDFTQPMQAAHGSVISDADGIRRTTLLFEQGTQVSMVLHNDSIILPSAINVRATEYTAGSNGIHAMPAPLPPTSGYTYCAQLTADEALAANAREVNFSKPVRFYVDNFLGFPVGIPVPVGVYNPRRGQWIPVDDGRVVGILGIVDGVANLVVDTTDVVADSARLAELGITLLERQYIATLYSPGQSILRTSINYFGMYDKNYGVIPTPGATPPSVHQPVQTDFEPQYPIPTTHAGLNIRNQTLAGNIELTGLPFKLHYESDRMPGREDQIRIRLSDDVLPPELRHIIVEVTVAGRRFTEIFPATAGASHVLTWDGKDVYGREYPGRHSARVRIGYAYPGSYQLPPFLRNNFAQTSGIPIPLIRSRQDVVLWQEMTTTLRSVDNRAVGLGGWSLTNHHAYDPEDHVLYLGNGKKQIAERMSGEVMTIAGGFGGAPRNGFPATQTNLGVGSFQAIAMAYGPDGSLYLCENHIVRRVWPDGIIRHFAGNDNPIGPLGDGGPAATAGLANLRDISVANDGTVYLVEGDPHFRIRKIDPDGIIHTIAGTGTLGFTGDGGPSHLARVREPLAVTVGPDGDVYFSDQNFVTAANQAHLQHFAVIRKIDQAGIITTVAGGGANYSLANMPSRAVALDPIYSMAFGPDGSLYFTSIRDSQFISSVFNVFNFYRTSVFRLRPDGILSWVGGKRDAEETNEDGIHATEATFGPTTRNYGNRAWMGIAVTRDGRIYLGSQYNIIRTIDPDGIVRTIVGKPTVVPNTGIFNGDGRTALATTLREPRHLVLNPEGWLVWYEYGFNRVRRLRSNQPIFTVGGFSVPANHGGELYDFDADGRHIRTRDALTGRALFTFGYDETGWLVSVRDRDSLLTQIERDAQGRPLAFISPFGQRSEISLDADGYLVALTNPLGELTRVQYGNGGLMTTMSPPLGNLSTYGYDTAGKVTSAARPDGGGGTLSRIETVNGHLVTARTTLGRNVQQSYERLSSGAERLVTVDPRGRQTVATLAPDGTDTLRTPDGMVTIQQKEYDPRFGQQVPIASETVVQTPSGLLSTQKHRRIISLVVGSEVKGVVDTMVQNGRSSINIYNDVQKLNTAISPEGRRSLTYLNTKDQVIRDSIPGIVSTTYEYDAQGRVITMRQRGRTTRYTYDNRGRLFTTTDPLGRRDSLFYDNAGRLTRQVFSDGRSVHYVYDANGNLTGITPPGRPAHTFAFDVNDRPEEYLPPVVSVDSHAATRYVYNLDNQITRTILPDSSSIDIHYDPLDGTLSQVAFDRGLLSFSYDEFSGNLSSVETPEGNRIDYTYDGSLPLTETWTGDVNGTVAVQYDSDFRVVKQIINGTDSVDFRYDKDNNLIGAGALKLRRNTANGLLERDTLGNITGLTTYTPLGELAGMDVRLNGSSIFTTSYTRDSLSRITHLTETVEGVSKTFGYDYDPAGRLWRVRLDGVLTAEYSYDLNGNRIAVQSGGAVDSGRYDDQDRLLEYAGDRYVYTRNGHLRHKIHNGDTTSYSYDNYGNLVSVQLPDGSVIEYVIDATNRRIGKKLNGNMVARYVYTGDLRPVAMLDTAGNVLERYVFATRVNVPDYIVKEGAVYRVVADHLGSVRFVVNALTGAVAQRLDYDEFGRVILDANPAFQPFGYAGGLYDAQTGLARFGARDYDAVTGRWTAKDPIGFKGGDGNLYGYVYSDPINSIDPNGENAWFQTSLLQFTFQSAARSAGIGAALAFGQSLASGQTGADLFYSTLIGAGAGAISGGFASSAKALLVSGFIAGSASDISSQIVDGRGVRELSLSRALASGFIGGVGNVLAPYLNPNSRVSREVILEIQSGLGTWFVTTMMDRVQ